MTGFTVRQCDPVFCSIAAVSKATQSSDNCNLQKGGREKGGRDGKQQVDIKSTVVDSVKCWQWICLPTELSLSHLDNTVNSNQDLVISNYSATRELGLRQVMNWQISAAIYLHFLLCRSFKRALLDRCAQQVTGLHRVTTYPTTGDKWHTAALNLC